MSSMYGRALAAALLLASLSACTVQEPPPLVLPTSVTPSPGAVPGLSPAAPPGSAAPSGSFAPPAATATPSGEKTTVDGRTVSGLPPGLALPPGSRVKDVVTNGESSTVILSAPQPSAVLDHYRRTGPPLGYRAGTDTGDVLALQGRGWTVGVTTQALQSTVTFQAVPPGEPTDPVTPAW